MDREQVQSRLSNALSIAIGMLALGVLVAVLVLSRRDAMPAGPSVVTHNPGVADLLLNPPLPDEVVEVDAYFSGAGVPPMPGGLRGGAAPDQVSCPSWSGSNAALTDQPFPAFIYVLGSVNSNLLPDDTAWLLATVPEATQPGVWIRPELPYRARFRGHFGDPAFVDCPHADRIFVVERIVTVYEQQPPDTVTDPLKLPDGYANWPRHHNADFGYSLPYPPDWTIEQVNDPDVLSAIALRSPQWPDDPVLMRVHADETHLDQYDPVSTPPLLQHGMAQFGQGGLFSAKGVSSQGLTGYVTWPDAGPDRDSIAVLLSGSGYTYELSVTYRLGFDAPQLLLAIYSAIVEGFRLDVLPGASPTPPVKQELGSGPFLTQDEALARLREQEKEIEVLEAQLMSEAEARRLSDCGIEGHPDGVWLFIVRGFFEGATRTMRLFLDATTGENLCGEEIAPTATPVPTLPPGVTVTLAPTLPPGVTATPAPPTPAPTPTPQGTQIPR